MAFLYSLLACVPFLCCSTSPRRGEIAVNKQGEKAETSHNISSMVHASITNRFTDIFGETHQNIWKCKVSQYLSSPDLLPKTDVSDVDNSVRAWPVHQSLHFSKEEFFEATFFLPGCSHTPSLCTISLASGLQSITSSRTELPHGQCVSVTDCLSG